MGCLPSTICTGLLLTKTRRIYREMVLLLTNSNNGTRLITIELLGPKCCSHFEEVLIELQGEQEMLVRGSKTPLSKPDSTVQNSTSAIQVQLSKCMTFLCHSVNFAQAIFVILHNSASIVLFHISQLQHLQFKK